MPDPKGNLVTPVCETADGKLKSILCDNAGRPEVTLAMGTTAKARVYLGIRQNNLVHGEWTKVLLDEASYDPSSLFTLNKITIKIPGYYLRITQLMWYEPSMVADKIYTVAHYTNGSSDLDYYIVGILNINQSVLLHDIAHYDVGDELELYARSAAGVDTVDIFHGSKRTFMAVHLLSAD